MSVRLESVFVAEYTYAADTRHRVFCRQDSRLARDLWLAGARFTSKQGARERHGFPPVRMQATRFGPGSGKAIRWSPGVRFWPRRRAAVRSRVP